MKVSHHLHHFKIYDKEAFIARLVKRLSDRWSDDSLQMLEYCKRFDRVLSGAISEIDLIVNSSVLDLMGFTLKKKLSRSLAKIHSGAYLDSGDSDSFVQNHIATFLNEISL